MTTVPTTDRVPLVRAIATQHLADRGALMPVLHDVVEELGHVSREDVEAIADVLNLSVDGGRDVDTVERALLGAAEADVVVVAAAGNAGAGKYAAHASPWVTSVGGTTGS